MLDVRVYRAAFLPVATGVAVLGVAGHRMTDRLQMGADLVGTPGMQAAADRAEATVERER